MSDIIGNSLRHVMNGDQELRSRLTYSSYDDLRHQVQEGLDQA